jgi:hypothetical protein
VESNFNKWIKLLFSKKFMFEVMLLAIHPIPYVEKEYPTKILNMLGSKDTYVDVRFFLGDFLFAFMFFRIYFLIGTILNFSVYSELYSKKICSKFRFESNTHFCIKAFFFKKPAHSILIFSLISILWFSYVLRIFER